MKSARIRLRPTRKVGCAPGFNTLGLENPEQNEAAERAHGTLETVAAPILRRLNAGDYNLDAQAWYDLLYFAAVLSMRGPNTRSTLNNMRLRGTELIIDTLGSLSPQAFLHQLEQTYPDREFTLDQAKDIQAWGNDRSKYTLSIAPHKAIETSLKTAVNTVLPFFEKMHWTYLHAPANRPFLCSDFPVVWINPSLPTTSGAGHGLKAREIEVSFPIGGSLALLGHWKPGPNHLCIPMELVDQINLRTIGYALVEILGPSRESVEWGLALRLGTSTK